MGFLPVQTRKYRISNTHGVHHGFDFAVPVGTGTVTPVSGRVRVVRTITRRQDPRGSYGQYVVVRDEDGNDHYFAHLSAFAVEEGQRVEAGDMIGLSGTSGNSTGPHLHYEVRDNRGRQVDPSRFFGDALSDAYAPVRAEIRVGASLADTSWVPAALSAFDYLRDLEAYEVRLPEEDDENLVEADETLLGDVEVAARVEAAGEPLIGQREGSDGV